MSEIIQMTKEELQAAIAAALAPMQAELNQLRGDSGKSNRLRPIRERSFNARMIEWGGQMRVAVGYRNRGTSTRPIYHYWKPDPRDPKEKIWYVDLVLDGMKDGEFYTIPFTEFRKESERVKAKIVNKHIEEWTINQGMTRKAMIQNDDYSRTVTDLEVPIDVVGEAITYEIELPAEYGSRRVHVPEMMNNIE